jgi:4-hydroxy-tetrahydrodipicolinate synthase
MTIFKGSGVALVTPFKIDTRGENVIDYDALERLIEYHIKNKTDSIIICGTTGEGSTLSEEEHSQCIRRCVEIVNGRIPVIAGTGSNDTKTAVMLSKKAEIDGANGLLCVTPYYNKTNQNGLKLYYKRIADSVNIPVIMYNVPSRTGVNILPETAISIAKDNPNVIGIKEASGNLEQVKAVADSGYLDVYSGNDDQIYDVLDLGGIGVISVLANIFPEETHNIVEEYLNGHTLESLKMQRDATKLIKALFSDVNPIPVKKAMELEGLCSGLIREPLIELDEEKTLHLSKAIDRYKKIVR